MRIVVNGQERQIGQSLTVADLLAQLELPSRGVAVELNLQVVPRDRHAERHLNDGDRLEVVSLVGGG